jgi:hypothetical protein
VPVAGAFAVQTMALIHDAADRAAFRSLAPAACGASVRVGQRLVGQPRVTRWMATLP